MKEKASSQSRGGGGGAAAPPALSSIHLCGYLEGSFFHLVQLRKILVENYFPL